MKRFPHWSVALMTGLLKQGKVRIIRAYATIRTAAEIK